MPTVQSIKAGMAVKAPVAKAAKAVKNASAKVASKAAESNKGAEALSNQGRAMVHYSKPSAEVVKMENPKTLKATSSFGGGDSGYGGGRGDRFSSIWDEGSAW